MELTELARRIDDVWAHGARAAELLYVHTEGHDAVWTDRGIDHATDAETHLQVRAWIDDGRSGVARGPVENLDALISEALATAESAGPNPNDGPVARQERELGGLGVFDKRRATLAETHREEVLNNAQASIAGAEGLSLTSLTYRDEATTRRFASSAGVALQESATRFTVDGAVMVTADDGTFPLTERIASRRYSSVATLPLGEFLARRARAVRQPGEVLPDGPVRVVLTPRATAQLFTHLGTAFTAATIAAGGLFIAAEDLPLDPRLHLIDDGALTGGLNTRAFDDRGVAPVALTLLRDGQLDGRFISVAEARAHDVRPTGHTMGGTLAHTNLVLKSGTRSINALLAELQGPSLRIDDLPDLSGVDLRTGAARLTVHGEVMNANKAVGSMRHVVIEGQLAEVLGKLVDVGNDTDRWASMDSPALITQGWTLSS